MTRIYPLTRDCKKKNEDAFYEMSVILLTSSCKIKYKDVLDFPEMIELTLYIYYDDRLENSEKLQKNLRKTK